MSSGYALHPEAFADLDDVREFHVAKARDYGTSNFNSVSAPNFRNGVY